jgi:nicotinate-nucleotide pyrophosphorylase (carboxylating)
MTNAHPDTHATSRTLLADSGVDHDHVLELVRTALTEDLAWGPDITTEATIAGDARGTAHVVARAPGTIAGLGVAAAAPEVLWEIADQSLPAVRVTALGRDGDHVMPGDAVLQLTGPLRLLLTAERTLLNLLCHLSGVATETARWVQALQSVPGPHPGRTRVSVRDTRKTVPGLRVLQKYAVRCGGGVNYRMGLGDAALIKDNHVAASGSITAALQAVRDRAPGITLEVECDTLAQVTEALTAGADLILLDNMATAEIRAAVALTYGYNAKLEASGGLSLDRAAEIAATGVDYVAVGALTHSAPALDLGLDLVADAATTPERVHPGGPHSAGWTP